ncbi:hypothetical protein KDL01_34750 [Actinospica durhamensis]|uniref:Uncharacterized protein n=1 Tax=Actinospica durhamensis TaxID=1508375 RepID=A0A941EWB1_9ACTN|nr:hypothetical protein [Actinospica durhamensis]MBR7838478.1 hypothetical protein [Actinospica durhamensis]
MNHRPQLAYALDLYGIALAADRQFEPAKAALAESLLVQCGFGADAARQEQTLGLLRSLEAEIAADAASYGDPDSRPSWWALAQIAGSAWIFTGMPVFVAGGAPTTSAARLVELISLAFLSLVYLVIATAFSRRLSVAAACYVGLLNVPNMIALARSG